MSGDAFWKVMFVVSFLNIFVVLEPFLSRDGYRQIIFAENAGWKARVRLFLALNFAFLVWAFVLAARV